MRRYAADPANFFRLAESALSPADFEIVDSELTRLLELTQTSADVADAMADVRLAERHSELKQASDRLRTVWLNEPNWREQVEEAFKQGASVSLIAPPDARGDLKSAILSLAVEPMELCYFVIAGIFR